MSVVAQMEDVALRRRQEESAPSTAASSNCDSNVELTQLSDSSPSEDDDGKRKRHTDDYTSFFRSTTWKSIVFCIIIFVPVSGLVTLPDLIYAQATLYIEGNSTKFAVEWEWNSSMIGHYCFALWIGVQFVFNFAMASFRDPGSCKGIKPTRSHTGQFQVAGHPEFFHGPAYCNICELWKPPRAHHCRNCGRCVQRMDHHCPFVGNCIGAQNHGNFILMFFFGMIGLAYSNYWSYHAVAMKWKALTKAMRRASRITHAMDIGRVFVAMADFPVITTRTYGLKVCLHCLASGLASIFIYGVGLGMIIVAATGETVLEVKFPKKVGSVEILPNVYCPIGNGFYGLGCRRNFITILGPRWYLRLLLPVPGGPHVSAVADPVACDTAIQQLHQKVKEVQENGTERRVESLDRLWPEEESAKSDSSSEEVQENGPARKVESLDNIWPEVPPAVASAQQVTLEP